MCQLMLLILNVRCCLDKDLRCIIPFVGDIYIEVVPSTIHTISVQLNVTLLHRPNNICVCIFITTAFYDVRMFDSKYKIPNITVQQHTLTGIITSSLVFPSIKQRFFARRQFTLIKNSKSVS